MNRPKKPIDIDELAMKHLTGHPNDRSGHILSRMNRRFGRAETDKSLRRVSQALTVLGVEHKKLPPFVPILDFKKMKPSTKPKWIGIDHAIKGQTASVVIMDEVGSVTEEKTNALKAIYNPTYQTGSNEAKSFDGHPFPFILPR